MLSGALWLAARASRFLAHEQESWHWLLPRSSARPMCLLSWCFPWASWAPPKHGGGTEGNQVEAVWPSLTQLWKPFNVTSIAFYLWKQSKLQPNSRRKNLIKEWPGPTKSSYCGPLWKVCSATERVPVHKEPEALCSPWPSPASLRLLIPSRNLLNMLQLSPDLSLCTNCLMKTWCLNYPFTF